MACRAMEPRATAPELDGPGDEPDWRLLKPALAVAAGADSYGFPLIRGHDSDQAGKRGVREGAGHRVALTSVVELRSCSSFPASSVNSAFAVPGSLKTHEIRCRAV